MKTIKAGFYRFIDIIEIPDSDEPTQIPLKIAIPNIEITTLEGVKGIVYIAGICDGILLAKDTIDSSEMETFIAFAAMNYNPPVIFEDESYNSTSLINMSVFIPYHNGWLPIFYNTSYQIINPSSFTSTDVSGYGKTFIVTSDTELEDSLADYFTSITTPLSPEPEPTPTPSSTKVKLVYNNEVIATVEDGEITLKNGAKGLAAKFPTMCSKLESNIELEIL